MVDINNLPGAIWRTTDQGEPVLMPASYRKAKFHCEANARESGRRIVEHEFPKKDDPYAEDMGRHAREFTIRGYCIVYPQDEDELFQRDYRIPRDKLIAALEEEGPAELQLPTQTLQVVVCTKYRMSEEERFGGYCTFDMTFLEYGLDPYINTSTVSTAQKVEDQSREARRQVLMHLTTPKGGLSLSPADVERLLDGDFSILGQLLSGRS